MWRYYGDISSCDKLIMDQTERPIKIPPEFSIYAEKHHIFEVFQVDEFWLLLQ